MSSEKERPYHCHLDLLDALQQLLGAGASEAEKLYALRYLRTGSVTRIYRRSWLARSSSAQEARVWRRRESNWRSI